VRRAAPGAGEGRATRRRAVLRHAAAWSGPAAGDPDFDLAWVADGVLHVCEIKSLTPENETAQLRLALGQVLEYRHRLAERGISVIAVIAVERPPKDPSRIEICGALEIPLVWPGAFRIH